MKILRNALSLLIVFSFLFGMINVYAADGEIPSNEIPYIAHDTAIAAQTYDGVVTSYSGQAGIDAGVPEGFSGEVIKVVPNTDGGHAGVCVDFSDQNISIEDIESITFRIYIPAGGESEFRIMNKAKAESWVVRAAPSVFSEWADVVLTNTSGFMNGYNLNTLANADGNLGSFCIIFRLKSPSEIATYIDAINIKYKAGVSDDKTPPVITYNGPTQFSAKEGDVFSLKGLSAFDEYDNTDATITYEWSAGAVSALGELQAGTHTCTVKAQDRSGNTASISVTVNVEANPFVIKLDSIPYTDYISGVSIYNGTVRNLFSNEAVAAGVPAGYSGDVLEVRGSSYRFGMTFDPTNIGIPICLIDRITFRLYLNETTNAIRMSNQGDAEWIVLANASAGQWMEYTLYADGTGFAGENNFLSFADADGKLGIFGIATKYTEGKDYVFYIDSIVINIKDDGGKPPVMTYQGETDIYTSAGKPFTPAIIAFDELEDRNVELEYEWSEGGVDENGNMLEGEHTCRVSATDYQGNTSYIDFNLTVGPKDVTPPEIMFVAEKIYVPVGTIDRMVISCVDDYDDVDVDIQWSAGAVDFGGRLNKGTHVLTLTATDLTGNKTIMVVTVYVTEDDEVVGKLIECGNL